MADKLQTEWAPRILSITRIVSALIFMAHGTAKIFNFPATERGAPEFMSQMWIGGWLEIVGGILLVLGLFTRPVAFILSGMMAVAYWQFHAPQSIYPLQNGGDAAILYCFIFLYIAFAGGGPWSVDELRKSGD
ncbi:MAG: DoxX family protein [Methyloceanibacter sp.]|nr:DoxX family protein [Methyloceanibacter sp.]